MKTTFKIFICTALCCAAASAFAAPTPDTVSLAFKGAAACAGPDVGSVTLNGAGTPDVYVQGTVTSSGSPVPCGKAHIFIATTVSAGVGTPTSAGTAGACLINISGGGVDLDANGQVCFPVDLDGLSSLTGLTDCDGNAVTLADVACPTGPIGFKVQFIPSGPGCDFAQNTSPGTDLTINCGGACGTNTNFTIGLEQTAGPGSPCPGSTQCWDYTITVQNCTDSDLTNVKIQGGTAAWISSQTVTDSNGFNITSVQRGGNNRVWTLTGALAQGASEHVNVHVCGTVSSHCDTVMFLSGAWSASGTKTSDHSKVATDYTGRASATVDCDTETCTMTP